MKYLDLFSGYGGFSLGIQKAYESLSPGREILSNTKNKTTHHCDEIRNSRDQNKECQNYELSGMGVESENSTDASGATSQYGERPLCIGFSEIDKYAIQTYSKHFQTHKPYGDITKLDPRTLPDFDLLCGGFPCQAFSIAGKRAGFEDTRGTLIYDVLRIAKEKRPRYLLLENVKGLLSHDNARTFKTILSAIAELGYAVEWQVLNAKNFGVPQNRERVFIIGHLGGFGGRKVFPLETSDSEHPEPNGQRNEVAYCLQAGGDKHRGSYVSVPEATKQGYAIAREGDSINLSVPNSKTRRGRVGGGIAQTLDTGMQQHTLQGAKIRRLTPTECERLMGLPDGWTEKGLSYIMEICVNTTNAIEKQLLGLGIVSCTTSDGKGMEVQICPSEKKEYASIVIDHPSLVDSVIDITNPLSDMVMLFNPSETLSIAEFIKKKGIYEKMEGKSTCKIWSVSLVGNYEKEKLSTILTSIQEITKKLTSTYVKTDENIIGVIIHLNSLEQNSLKEASLVLKMGSIESVSDAQRYKLCGNGVVVNVVEEIMKRLK